MAIYDPRYEVAWQLSEDDNDGSAVVERGGRASRENYASLARFAGLLAGAEVAAVTLCRGEGLIIEFTDPPSPWLAAGPLCGHNRPTVPMTSGAWLAFDGPRAVVLVQASNRFLQCGLDRRPRAGCLTTPVTGGQPRGAAKRGKPRASGVLPGAGRRLGPSQPRAQKRPRLHREEPES